MAKNDDSKKQEPFLLPEARVIHHSLFSKDKFNDEATPAYKIEVAIPSDSEELVALGEKLFAFADEVFGGGNYDEDDLILPLKDGDKMAAKRKRNGKSGDAYEGMIVIRANTIYNKDGEDAPGGIQVFDEDVEEVGAANKEVIYPGCYGQVGVTMSSYEDAKTGDPAITFYMTAFQKTGDGERLVIQRDHSKLFKPTGRKRTDAESGGKRRRRRT